jgi:hypothetical protein
LATLGVLLFSVPLFSQGSNGRILGAVTDQTGGVISGATVTIIDKDRGVAATLTTDVAGEYNAPNLIPSTYIVRAEAKGFKRLERQNIAIQVGSELRVDLTVQPGEQTQTVTVTEAIPLVETTNATLGGTLSNTELIDIPLNGRNYQNLMGLRPGVMLQPGGSPWTQSTNGGRPDETGWMLEGVVNEVFFDARPLQGTTSPFTDGATIVPIDAIQEFNMQENPKAEYGWKTGAVVNVGLKSGTNNLHGTAYAFGRSDALDARNTFNPPLDPTGTCPQDGEKPDTDGVCNKAQAQLKQFGATVGGPIKKDKLFYFAAYEGLRSLVSNIFIETLPSTGQMVSAISGLQALGAKGPCSATNAGNSTKLPNNCLSPVSLALVGCTPTGAAFTSPYICVGAGSPGATAGTFVPSSSGLFGEQHASATGTTYSSNFPNRNTSDNGVFKLDYRINNKNSLTGSALIGNYSSEGEDHPIANTNWRNTVPIRGQTYTADWIFNPSSTWVNDVRFAYNRFNFSLLNGDANLFADGKSYPVNTGITSTGGMPTVYLSGASGFGVAGGFWLGGWRGRPLETGPSPYYDIQDSVSYLRGKHSFKFGGEFAHIEVDENPHDTRGRFDIAGGGGPTAQIQTLEDFFSGNFKDLQQLIGNPARKLTWTSTAGFIQDDYRLTPKLMVNLGLRYAYVSPFKDASGQLGNFDPNSPTGLVQQGVGGVNSIVKPDRKNFSPRLGFAWDVTGKGTTVVRGGGSILFTSWQVAAFLANPGPSGDHNHATSLAVNPTGFNCVVGPGCPNGTLGGTNATGNLVLPAKSILWDSSSAAPPVPSAGLCGPVGSAPNAAPCDLFAVDPNLRYPYIINWNLGITHAFTPNTSLEVGYVGNHGTSLTGLRDLNQGEVVNGVVQTDASGNPILPYAKQFPDFRYINYVSNDSSSNYDGLQATLTQRVTHGLSFTAGYTYSHALDDGSLNRFGTLPANSYDVRAEYGSSDLDVRHHFTLTASYAIPGRKGFGQLLEGWKLNTVVTLQSGLPWGPMDTGNNFSNNQFNGGEENDRWDFFGNYADFKSPGSSTLPNCTGVIGVAGSASCTVTSGISGLVTTFSPSQSQAMWNQCIAHAADATSGGTLEQGGCFVAGNSVLTPAAMNHFGTLGRNPFRDQGFKDLDFSLFKDFKLTERWGAEFRFEVFNLLNHPLFANPYGAAAGGLGNDPSGPSTFGCGCATPDVGNGNALIGSGSARVMQLGLKLMF